MAVNEINLPEIKIAAAVIVDDLGKVLLVRKKGTSAFMQPGGKIENNEQPEACLVRELAEELGVQANLEDIEPLGVFSALAANEKGSIVTAVLFKARLLDQPIAAAEIDELIWLDANEPNEGIDLAPLTRDEVLPIVLRLNDA